MVNSISDLMGLDIDKESIIIRLDDNGRSVDILSNDDKCVHLYVDNCRCRSCGGFVGKIGRERSYKDYCNHIYHLSNSFRRSREVYVVTDRLYPNEFSLSGRYFGGGIFKYCEVYTLYSVVVKQVKPFLGCKYFYIIHFTNDRGRVWDNKVVYSNKFSIRSLFINSDTLFVNPIVRDLSYISSFFTYFVCNSVVDDFIKKNRLDLMRF